MYKRMNLCPSCLLHRLPVSSLWPEEISSKVLETGKRRRKVLFKARPLSWQPQWKVPNLWQLWVMLKKVRPLVPEVLLSEAGQVCSSSHLFPLSRPVAAGEMVKGAAVVAKAS